MHGALRRIGYRAPTEAAGREALKAFGERWDATYPTISLSWHQHWDELSVFYGYPKDIRRVIYTTNAVESLNRSLRKVLKTRGALPSDEALMKLLYLAVEKISKKWTRPVKNRPAALNRFALTFEGCVPLPLPAAAYTKNLTPSIGGSAAFPCCH